MTATALGHRLLLFPSTHQALAAEECLRAAGVKIEVVPTPPEFSSGCGLAIRVMLSDLEGVRAALSLHGVRYTSPKTG